MKRVRVSRSSRRVNRYSRHAAVETLEQRLVLHGHALSQLVSHAIVSPTGSAATSTLVISANSAKAATAPITPFGSLPNHAPIFTKGSDQTVLEDSGSQKVLHWATGISAGSSSEQKQKLTFVVTTDTPKFFSSAPKIDASGTLTYTPALDANGTATVSVRLTDNGGTSNGGVDTSPTQTFTINVTPVNDRPKFTSGRDQTVSEDSGTTTVAQWAKSFVPGPTNESSQTVTFVVSTDNASLFSIVPTVSPNGNLSFTPAPNASGKAKVTVRLKDDGGTANRGSDTSDPHTLFITINPVNDAPTFVKGADQSVPKGSGAQTVSAWAKAISPGAPNESSQKLSFVVSVDKPSLFSSQPKISSNGTLTYKPASSASGTAIVTVRLKDNGGTKSGGHDTSLPQTFSIGIGSTANVAPSFTKGPNQVALEDSGSQSVAAWATGISAGPASESSQTLSFIVSNDNSALFATQPTIGSNGTLAYAFAPNANGSATVTVKLKDSGGTANGGNDTSAAQTFTITATPVNDAPSFLKGADQQVDASAGAVSVSGWATAISAGPSDESGQALAFQVQAADSSLFTVQPAISANGTLTFTPAVGTSGTTIITVQLKDGAGTANGGHDTSDAQQFNISIASAAAGPLIDAALANDTAPGGLTNSDGITSDPKFAGSVFDSEGVASLTVAIDSGAAVPVTINTDGTFVFDPALARDGSADGNHIAHFVARNQSGGTSRFNLSFTLDTVVPLAPSLILSAASGLVSSQTSNASRVTLLGTTDPGITVTLVQPAMTALANSAGNFQFVSVPLNLGDNVFTTIATDAAGNTVQTQTTIRRVTATTSLDPVLLWNQTVLQALRTDASDPTRASRGMAMVQSAIYDAVNAIEGRTGYYVTMAAPTGASLEASISGAANQVLTYLFPAQHELFDAVLATSLGNVPDGPTETISVSFGRQVGDAIIALRANDGWDKYVDHVPVNEPGLWQPTGPMFAVALDPQWATMQPWVMTSPDQFLPSGPPSLSSQEWANAYNEVKTLGAYNSTVRTADQTQIARFWADGAGTSSPPGHWNLVAEQVATAAGNSIAENARLFAMLDITLADAAIVAWNAKYTDDFWRPITAIQNGGTDGNDLTVADPNWLPFLITPPFPEYISGHSTFSGAAAAVMTAEFGDNYAFTATSEGLVGVTRSFTSFDAAADEAGRSRIYGGIHWEFSNQDGKAAGHALADYILKTFDTSTDTIAPRVIFDTDSNQATATNISIVGHVLDNLSGVASLTASVDGGAAVPVSFNAQGRFTLLTSLSLNGSADGSHTVSFVATDASGNISAPAPIVFTLDTVAPTLNIQSPTSNGSLAAGDSLTGSVTTSGSSIVALSYKFSGQPTMPIAFDAQTGAFNAPLSLAKLSPGSTTLTISTSDAAGNTKTTTLNLNLAARVSFNIASFTPLDGAQDVGSTYRPQVFFSRAVNPSSLTSTNFYATGPSGAKLAANIVPSGDGTFAWLFFTQPMPSSSEITVHLDGSTILAAGDGVALDADGNGSAGGQFSFKFTTVSLTPLAGTSLSGKVLDVGPDLKPMTFDDIRVGPDQVMHTADDVFLLPIAGVKVSIVGMENSAVFTDASGNFHFDSVPAGDVKLAIDGRTATNAPAGIFFPEMVMDLVLEAGRANTVMGTMGTNEEKAANRDRKEVYLPRLETSILQNVSNSVPTMITVGPDAAANLTAEQRSMLTVNVQPGSLRDQFGNPVAAGQVGISTVPPSLVRDMLPAGLLQHTFDITVQAPGITNFATPAPMTFPNLFNGKPGEKLNFLSFDHTTGKLVIEGSATVSADGLSVSTDPGTGITHPGWHGLAPQGSPTSPQVPIVASAGSSPVVPFVSGVNDFLFTNDSPGKLIFKNNADPLAPNPYGSFMRVVITVDPTISHYFLDGLRTQTIDLYAGSAQSVPFSFLQRDISKLTNDLLVGASYKVEIFKVNIGGSTQLLNSNTVNIYRYFDAMDSDPNDGVLEFADTMADGRGTVLRNRTLDYLGDVSAKPTITFQNTVDDSFGVADSGNQLKLVFDPLQTAGDSRADIQLMTPGPNPRVVSSSPKFIAEGHAVQPVTVYLNRDQFLKAFHDLSNDVSPVSLGISYDATKLNERPLNTFQISVANLQGLVKITQPIPINSSAAVVKNALEALDGIGPGGVDVSFTHEEVKFAGLVVRYHDTYLIQPRNAFAGIPTPAMDLVDAGTNIQVTSLRHAPLGELTRDQTEALQQPNAIETLYTKMKEQLVANYSIYNDRDIKFDDGAPPNIGDISLNWVIDTPADGGTQTAQFPAPALQPLLDTFFEIAAKGAKLNSSQIAFKIAQTLSKSLAQRTFPGIVYTQRLFTPSHLGHANITLPELSALVGSIAAHEIGHRLGLPHSTRFPYIIPGTNEVQKIVVTPGSANFSLMYAGATTGAIPAMSPAIVVENALAALPGLTTSQVHVTGPNGGPYTITFLNSAYSTDDVPQITGVNVNASTISNGHDTLGYSAEVVIGGEKGRDDLMRPTTSGDPRLFQPLISGVFLHMALGDTWGDSEAKVVLSLLAQYALVGSLPVISPPPTTPGETSSDLNDFVYKGPGLMLLNADGMLADEQPLDFGNADPGSPVTKTLKLINFGGQPVVVRSVGVTQGYDRFSIPPITVTTLQPGESLDINVTFNSAMNLSSSGLLVVDSDVEVLGANVELSGSGQAANRPAIHVDFLYNNLQGVQVGDVSGIDPGQTPTITNRGSAPLTITDIRVAAGQGHDEYSVAPLAAPIVLAPGESTHFGATFRPSKLGLRPGAFEIVSDDPNTPVVRLAIVGTGVSTHDQYHTFDGADVGNDYVAVEAGFGETNLPVLRTKSDDGGNWEFFLPANFGIHIATYDPVSGLIAHSYDATNDSGVRTQINVGLFHPSVDQDSDGDGLPDDIEFAIGTNPNNIDTDGDGKNDFAELDSGQNPIDDRPAATGVVSALPVGGQAHDVALAPDFRDLSRSLAYVASGSGGLTVVDVTDFARPIAIAQLALTGSVDHVSIDLDRKLLAASSPTGGVFVIDISNPAQPILRHTISAGSDTTASVEMVDGLVYAAVGQNLKVYSAESGEFSAGLALGDQRVLGMTSSNSGLYLTVLDNPSNQPMLRIIDITAAGLSAVSSTPLPVPNPLGVPDPTKFSDPFIDTRTGIAWIPAEDRVVTVNISNPQNPQIISGSQTLQGALINDIQLNGSGLGVAAGTEAPGGSVVVLQTSNPQSPNQVFTRFTLPIPAERAALASGFAYVADGTKGLQLVSYLQFDTGSTPPTIHLDPIAGDVNPGQTGLQLYEGTTITVPNQISDDVQVRSVELLFDGVVVLKDLSYPYDLTAVLPKIADTGNQVVLQVRATDTGGNVQLSDPLVIDLLKDVTPPTVATLDPPDGSTQPQSRRQVSIQFSEPLNRATIVPANFVLHGPNGNVTPVSVDLRQHDARVEILYPPLAEGDYQFTMHAAAITDRVGNPLGAADTTSTFHVGIAVRVPTIQWVNTAGGDWSDPNNWRDVATNTPRVPTATDDVMIDVPTDALVTLSTGSVTVNSVISNERFQITAARLNVTDTIQVNNTFLLNSTNNLAPATLGGTVLRGTGGQGMTIEGESRLDGATVETDIAIVTTSQQAALLRIAHGLALTGTATVSGGHVQIGIEGSETISSGTFIAAGSTPDSAKLYFEPVGTSSVTFGPDVLIRGEVVMWNEGGSFQTVVPNLLSVINQGTITGAGLSEQYKFETDADSFINQGIVNTDQVAVLYMLAKTWTNTSTGHITLNGATLADSSLRGSFGGVSTTSWSNAGTIELINSQAQFMPDIGSENKTWANTGSIIVNQSFLSLHGKFTSDDVVNVRNSGHVLIAGQMDNTGRTFTFNNDTQSYILINGGTILGGTLVTTGLTSRLEFSLGGGTTPPPKLDGVTIQGDLGIGQIVPDFLRGRDAYTGGVHIVHGLTLHGTMDIYPTGNVVDFDGAQTVSGGVIEFPAAEPGTLSTGVNYGYIRAYAGGPVVFDSTVTFHAAASAGGPYGGVQGSIINNAAVLLDANAGIGFGGSETSNPAFQGPFINRSTFTVPATRTLTLDSPFVNEGQIIISGGSVRAHADFGWSNTGTIDLTGGGQLTFGYQYPGSYVPPPFTTSALGNLIDSGGIVRLQDDFQIDNSNATLTLHGTADWQLLDAGITGGTIVIPATATLEMSSGANGSNTGELKDLTVNGNVRVDRFSSMTLVGDLRFNGTVSDSDVGANIVLGDPNLYPNVPVHILAGAFDLGGQGSSPTLVGSNLTPSIKLDPGVELRGRGMSATLTTPITNQGTIVADQRYTSTVGDVFSFTAAPITNQGTLSAVDKSILRIANLAAPNSGIVSATAGSSVAFTGAFAQAAAGTVHVDVGGTAADQFGLVAVAGAATLTGILDVQFASGYTPAAGNTFKVMTFASKTGQFTSVHVAGLASSLTVTPQYNGTDVTLVIGTAGARSALTAAPVAPGSAEEQTAAIGAAFEQLGANNSQALTLAATQSANHVDALLVEFAADDGLKNANGAAHDSLSEHLSSTEAGSNEDLSAASDEVFASIGDESLLTMV